MKKTPTPTIVQPGRGKDLHAFGNILTVMLGSNQTGNQVSVMSEVTPPQAARPCTFITGNRIRPITISFLIFEGVCNRLFHRHGTTPSAKCFQLRIPKFLTQDGCEAL